LQVAVLAPEHFSSADVTHAYVMTAVTAEGIFLATQLMSKGWLNRYQPPLVEGECEEEHMTYLLQCEQALASYIGEQLARVTLLRL